MFRLSAAILVLSAWSCAPEADDRKEDDGPSEMSIYELRTSSSVGTKVTVRDATVTGVITVGNGDVRIYIQDDPEASRTENEAFPENSGVLVYIANDDETPPPDGLEVGRCLSVTGEVIEFQGTTEIGYVEAAEVDVTCNRNVTPTTVPLLFVATDTDSDQAGFQPGPLADEYQSLLVTVEDLAVVSASRTGDYTVGPIGDDTATLIISDFLAGTGTLGVHDVGTEFAEITGFLGSFNNVHLEPRSATDLLTQ
jgi:hypothetical protein